MASHGRENALIARVLGEPGSSVRSTAPDPPAVGAEIDWDFLSARAVAHGLAPLLLRDAAALALSIPDPARERLATAAELCRGRAKKCQFTLYRYLEAGARRRLETALLKGVALVGSAYADPRVRPMEDVDLLVRSDDLALAREVGEEIGLGLGSSQLPAFYYRLMHFAQSLQPHVETLVPLDLHWRLHSPALLLTDRIEQVWARRRTASVYGFPTAVLDPADQWLHLATHFWSHWGRTPAPAEAPEAIVLADEPGVAVALKWAVDLVCATSRLAREIRPETLAERAAEWSAQAQTAATLALLRPFLAPPGLAFAQPVLAAVDGALPAPVRRRRHPPPPIGEVAHRGLGFRLGSLRRLPAWIVPPERYLRAVSRLEPAGHASRLTLLRIRLVHAARVLTRAGVAAAALPIAVLGRRLARRRRTQRIRAARSPAHVIELLRQFREFEIAYADRFALDRPEHRDV